MTTTHRAPRIRTTAVALATTALLLTGCGGKDASAGPLPSASSSTASDPTPGTAPATGALMDSLAVTLHAPKGWGVDVEVEGRTLTAHDSESMSFVGVNVVDTFGKHHTLTQLADATRRTGIWEPLPAIEDETEVAGTPAWHIHGRITGGRRVLDGYGFATGDKAVALLFTMDPSVRTAEQRQQIIASVLATVEVK